MSLLAIIEGNDIVLNVKLADGGIIDIDEDIVADRTEKLLVGTGVITLTLVVMNVVCVTGLAVLVTVECVVLPALPIVKKVENALVSNIGFFDGSIIDVGEGIIVDRSGN